MDISVSDFDIEVMYCNVVDLTANTLPKLRAITFEQER